jgi:branched-chain amino acid transport system substrate-binding protein
MRFIPGLAVGATTALLSVGVAACGESHKTDTGSNGQKGASQPAPGTSADAAKCGLGNGKPASGSPIKIGAIVTKQPGTDFTDITNGAKAYFDCVNANGGINGRPIKYSVETEQTDPGQVASKARKLIESEGIVAMVGNISLIDCAVNQNYYAAKGFNVISAGIAPECYAKPNIAAVNMGARYSTDGAAQALIRKGAKKLVYVGTNVPGVGYFAGGLKLLAKAEGLPDPQVFKELSPIQDANSAVLKAVQAAGSGGGVVINLTPPEALKILQAAQRQGLQDRVKWACSTPCNTDFLAKALGSAWNGKLFVNAEARLADHVGPDTALYRDIMQKYAPKVPVGSFSQFGFLQGRIATQALVGIKGSITVQSANEAIQAVKDFKTDMLCRPWYFGKAPVHIPNNVDLTVTPKDGKMVEDEDCFQISDAEPVIKQVRQIEQQQGA